MGKITTEKRKSLSRGKFALPPRPEEKRRDIAGRYPIPDAAHARNALARVSQHGTKSEQEAVRRAVKREFPNIEQKHKRGRK